ncbi:protein RESTRICTED TEV MOVEMENT 3 isoform X2 [Actinidia eriantha]|uniref:protein RESTRICTED TEV MOVEMENT 3 isoform X2 n=1 Tax=Actinidia eriantha TaxID=165200 RepID=UPI0025854BBE|nr:protein RESTRICTED TEV MOVEMENT 3 isoform X2 [Actinidia eriantha]
MAEAGAPIIYDQLAAKSTIHDQHGMAPPTVQHGMQEAAEAPKPIVHDQPGMEEAPKPIVHDQPVVSTTVATPAHYTVKIQLLSLLKTNKLERYESGEFGVGGYKWKLAIYPNGNKVECHLSLYLVMVEESSLQPGWEVHAGFRLFLFAQKEDKYFVCQDPMEKRFHREKHEWGFDEFISLKEFKESPKGYLVDDTCVFGAEVFVKERITWKGECLSMIKDAINYKTNWEINKFSKLGAKFCESKEFNAGDQKWKIKMYPKGRDTGMGTHISLFLALTEPETLAPTTKIFAEFTICIHDLKHKSDYSSTTSYWFSSSKPEWGWRRFIPLHYFSLPENGFLVKDKCWVQAEVTIHGVVTPM